MSLRQHVDDLNQMILNGAILDAFEKYYDENVVMSENGQDHRRGKEANRAYEQQFVSGIKSFHGAEVKSSAVNETAPDSGTAFSEWFMHFDHEHFGDDTRMMQVAVQKWENGQIVEETFYHG